MSDTSRLETSAEERADWRYSLQRLKHDGPLSGHLEFVDRLLADQLRGEVERDTLRIALGEARGVLEANMTVRDWGTSQAWQRVEQQIAHIDKLLTDKTA